MTTQTLPDSRMSSRKPLILIIDDTPVNLMMLGNALSQDFDLQTATSGAIGLALARATVPDLILLDIMMRDLNGYEACRLLKEEPRLKDVPVIFVTALNDYESEEKGLLLGAADYITKPFNVAVARQRIRNLLERERLRKELESQRDLLQHQIAETELAKAKLLESETRLRTIIEAEPECVYILDANGHLIQINKAGLSMMEAEHPGQILGKSLQNLLLPDYQAAFKLLHQRIMAGETATLTFEIKGLKGTHRWLETHAVPMQDDGAIEHLAITRDITERKLLEDQVYQLAFHDPLTALPNRRLLNDRLHQTLSVSKRNVFHGAVMFLDLDNFKPLNDRYGHDMGDLLLIEVAKRLRSCVREVDTVARIGGDEFVVMLQGLNSDTGQATAQARHVAEKIRAALCTPYVLTPSTEGQSPVQHRCAASIGVVLFFGAQVSKDQLVQQADMAMYQAKHKGRNQVHFYDANSEKGTSL